MRIDEHPVVAAPNLFKAIPHGVEEILVCREDISLCVKLDDRLRPVYRINERGKRSRFLFKFYDAVASFADHVASEGWTRPTFIQTCLEISYVFFGNELFVSKSFVLK
ncbi:hypothetical protein [Brevundimonas sp.]|uniref:hypothetical protein n=1 Tax=Brevundimonas sp. TaxID=1871086 RepID=UPI0025C4DEB1|nr:hypothetical protein [Brevundimonas sp.]